jgi:hypothetical protein
LDSFFRATPFYEVAIGIGSEDIAFSSEVSHEYWIYEDLMKATVLAA